MLAGALVARALVAGALVRALVVLGLLAVVVVEARPVAPALALAVEIFRAVVALLLVFFGRFSLQIRPVFAGLLVLFCN